MFSWSRDWDFPPAHERRRWEFRACLHQCVPLRFHLISNLVCSAEIASGFVSYLQSRIKDEGLNATAILTDDKSIGIQVWHHQPVRVHIGS
jgi:hypothetical protein